MFRSTAAVALLLASTASLAQTNNLAAAFGAREGVSQASLSPDGTKIALVAPGPFQSSTVFVIDTTPGTAPRRILQASGKPERIGSCSWAANTRLICTVWGVVPQQEFVRGFATVVALDDTGGNQRYLDKRQSSDALYHSGFGGAVIDLLPKEDGAALMVRDYVPESDMGKISAKTAEGLGVDRIDTRTGASKKVEPPRRDATGYLTDGYGTVRIMGTQGADADGYSKSSTQFVYRTATSRDWRKLGSYDSNSRQGIRPVAVDPTRNVAYSFERVDGRSVLTETTLGETPERKVLVERPDVDVDGLVQIGRQQRVVGASYETDRRHMVFFDPPTKAMMAALGKALGGKELALIDASADENKLLIHAGTDDDPGQYYLFDKVAKKLTPVVPDRPDLAGIKLATDQAITYPAADGTMIPAYLTLPPGGSGKNLPAIVMPHGGPEARDSWGFDWLSQYFAARGFAVIRPQFRGSDGYGDAWFKKNGFKSWRTAIGDVTDAGRYLVKAGIADPNKLGIFGWSYGGYAALQSAVVAPTLFKSVVAVAPVTDLATLTANSRFFTNYNIEKDFIGSGAHIREGSPAQNVAAITAPVLVFQGTVDANVPQQQARYFDTQMKGAGKREELVIFEGLDHYLEDSSARTTMLQRSADFLLAAGK